MMAEEYSGPSKDRLRKNLGDLVTDGLLTYHVADVGGDLLELRIVIDRVELRKGASEDEHDAAYTKALTEVLAEAVEKPTIRGKHRRLLKYVLPLKEEYLGKDVKKRRAAAAKAIKGKKNVKPGTVRTYHEPRALESLAAVLVVMEAEFCGQIRPDMEPSAD